MFEDTLIVIKKDANGAIVRSTLTGRITRIDWDTYNKCTKPVEGNSFQVVLTGMTLSQYFWMKGHKNEVVVATKDSSVKGLSALGMLVRDFSRVAHLDGLDTPEILDQFQFVLDSI